MSDKIAFESNPWWPLIRGAFRVPDHVSDANAVKIIARRMIDETATTEPRFEPAEASNWSATFGPATDHVAALLGASEAGELDLPLCNLGDIGYVEGSTVPYIAVPRDVALGAVGSRLSGPAHQPWVTWLWTNFYNHVAKYTTEPADGTTHA